MNVRAATRTDLPGIRDVANRSLAASYDDVLDADTRQQAVEAWYGTDHTSPGALAEEIEGERTLVLVAEEANSGIDDSSIDNSSIDDSSIDDSSIAGFVQAYLSGDDPRIGQIEWLHVRPDRRSEGIAERLLDEVESALVDRGADRIESRVVEANEAGTEFYEHHGYEAGQTRQVRLADDQVTELTLVADEATTDDGFTDHRETDDGETVIIAYDETERGTDGAFHATYREDDRGERYGWHCGVCDSFDVNMSTMGEMVCDDCGNERLATRWDATYGG